MERLSASPFGPRKDKTYGIKVRCYWEHPWEHIGNVRNILGTLWELEGNMLVTKRKWIYFFPFTQNLKEKNQSTLIGCMKLIFLKLFIIIFHMCAGFLESPLATTAEYKKSHTVDDSRTRPKSSNLRPRWFPAINKFQRWWFSRRWFRSDNWGATSGFVKLSTDSSEAV
jgi:hypothetical protein